MDVAQGLNIVESFQNRRVLVLGDLMLDRYWWGTVNRISPEAPVPVILKHRSSAALGGAANVARNITSLGGVAFLIGVVGSDSAGSEFRAALAAAGLAADCLISDANRPTTVKTRIVAHNQHVARVDEETTSAITTSLRDQILERVRSVLPLSDVVVVSDYAKGLLIPDLLREVIKLASEMGKLVVIDPKGLDYSRYAGATVLSPNRTEVLTAAGFLPSQVDSIASAADRLLNTVRMDALLVTEGEGGMTLFERGQPTRHFAALARAVYDVTGAGDTVVAVLSLALGCGAKRWHAVQLANLAAGLAVEQFGTAAVTSAQLREALQDGRHIALVPIDSLGRSTAQRRPGLPT